MNIFIRRTSWKLGINCNMDMRKNIRRWRKHSWPSFVKKDFGTFCYKVLKSISYLKLLYRSLWKGNLSATYLWITYGMVQFSVYGKLKHLAECSPDPLSYLKLDSNHHDAPPYQKQNSRLWKTFLLFLAGAGIVLDLFKKLKINSPAFHRSWHRCHSSNLSLRYHEDSIRHPSENFNYHVPPPITRLIWITGHH